MSSRPIADHTADGSPLDVDIARLRRGELGLQALVMQFLEAQIIVPSGSPLDGTGAFAPVLIDYGVDRYLAAFTTEAGATAVSHIAPFSATLSGRDVVAGLDDGIGVVINPGSNGFDIDPRLAATIRENLYPPQSS